MLAASDAKAGSSGFKLLAHLGKSERRSSVRLYKSWDAARGEAPMPKLCDFDLSVLEELGASCFLLVAGPEGEASRFRYFGRNLAQETGLDLTGRSLSEVPRSSLLSRVLGHYIEATQRQVPFLPPFEHAPCGLEPPTKRRLKSPRSLRLSQKKI